LLSQYFLSGGQSPCRRYLLPLTLNAPSGNGLVSYYINLVLEGVGITNPRTKQAINGGLQVSSPKTMSEIISLTLGCSAGILQVR
jgi:hypothetical protein